MTAEVQQLRTALKALSDLALILANGHATAPEASVKIITCTPKRLPRAKWIDAAKRAIEVGGRFIRRPSISDN